VLTAALEVIQQGGQRCARPAPPAQPAHHERMRVLTVCPAQQHQRVAVPRASRVQPAPRRMSTKQGSANNARRDVRNQVQGRAHVQFAGPEPSLQLLARQRVKFVLQGPSHLLQRPSRARSALRVSFNELRGKALVRSARRVVSTTKLGKRLVKTALAICFLWQEVRVVVCASRVSTTLFRESASVARVGFRVP